MGRLRSVQTSTTHPHVNVVDLDLTFRDLWWDALEKGLDALVPSLGQQHRIIYRRFIAAQVDGWGPRGNVGRDGLLLVRIRRHLWRRQASPVIRITGVRLGVNDSEEPSAIACLLYEPELTEPAREMLAGIGNELGVRYDLTLYRTALPRRSWKWLPLYSQE